MSSRAWKWVAALGLIGAGDLALAIHSRATWHPTTDSPSVMTLGQLLGFVTGTVLLLLAVLVAVNTVRTTRRRRRFVRLTESMRRQGGFEP